jgi:hypothetical protein
VLDTKLRAEEEAKRMEEEAARKEKEEQERKEREERQRAERERRQKEIQELEALEADLKRKNSISEPPGISLPRSFYLTLIYFILLYFFSVSDGLSVEDFESTLAELQSFIDGDVLTSLGDSGVAQGTPSAGTQLIFRYGLLNTNQYLGKTKEQAEQEQRVSLAPIPNAAPQPYEDGFVDDVMDTPAENAGPSKVEHDCLENYDVEEVCSMSTFSASLTMPT